MGEAIRGGSATDHPKGGDEAAPITGGVPVDEVHEGGLLPGPEQPQAQHPCYQEDQNPPPAELSHRSMPSV